MSTAPEPIPDEMPDRKPLGRPSKYNPDMPERARKACATYGSIDTQLAEFLGVTDSTLALWKTQHADFSDAIKQGKDQYDTHHVENSLLKRALGFKNDEVKIFQYQGEPVVVPYKAYYPPEVAAQIFWLKNRDPKRWRDKIEHSVTVDGSVEVIPALSAKFSELYAWRQSAIDVPALPAPESDSEE